MAKSASYSVPYAGATSGAAAREDISKILRRFGCESIGFMDDYEKGEVLLYISRMASLPRYRQAAKRPARAVGPRVVLLGTGDSKMTYQLGNRIYQVKEVNGRYFYWSPLAFRWLQKSKVTQ